MTQTYMLIVVERHIRTATDRKDGVENVVHAHLQGDLDLIAYAVGQLPGRLDPGEQYEIWLYAHDRPFGTNTEALLTATTTGDRVVPMLTEIILEARR